MTNKRGKPDALVVVLAAIGLLFAGRVLTATRTDLSHELVALARLDPTGRNAQFVGKAEGNLALPEVSCDLVGIVASPSAARLHFFNMIGATNRDGLVLADNVREGEVARDAIVLLADAARVKLLVGNEVLGDGVSAHLDLGITVSRKIVHANAEHLLAHGRSVGALNVVFNATVVLVAVLVFFIRLDMEALMETKVGVLVGMNDCRCRVGRSSRLLGVLKVEVGVVGDTLALPEDHPTEAMIIATALCLRHVFGTDEVKVVGVGVHSGIAIAVVFIAVNQVDCIVGIGTDTNCGSRNSCSCGWSRQESCIFIVVFIIIITLVVGVGSFRFLGGSNGNSGRINGLLAGSCRDFLRRSLWRSGFHFLSDGGEKQLVSNVGLDR